MPVNQMAGADVAIERHQLVEEAARHNTGSIAFRKAAVLTMTIPRGASAGASSRNATRFNAPMGSPASGARAGAVISDSI
jgi:hypothetical protein